MGIKTTKDLKEYLEVERKLYLTDSKLLNLKLLLTKEQRFMIWKFLKYLRKDEYYLNNQTNIVNKIILIFIRRKKNHLGNLLGLDIHSNSINKGLMIYHSGNIIINSLSNIGENCKFHGDNCIGNNGRVNGQPTLGKNVELGIGAKIIGDVYIADNVIIGANAVVTKSCYNENGILVGVPAIDIAKVK